MKRKLSLIMSFMLIFTVMFGGITLSPVDAAESSINNIQPNIVDSLITCENKAVWLIDNFANDYGRFEYFASFTITEDSIIEIDCKFGTAGVHTKSAWLYLSTTPDCDTYLTAVNHEDTKPPCVTLKAGTYYLKLESGIGEPCGHPINVYVNVLPLNKAVNVKQKKLSYGKKVKFSYEQCIRNTDDYKWSLYSGKVDESNVDSKTAIETWYDANSLSYTVNKNGVYTIAISLDRYDLMDSYEFYYSFKVTDVDEKSPTVKGIKNGKTYKKKVTVYVKDNVAIKQVKDGSKKVKIVKVKKGKYKGYYKFTITKKGKHKLKVYDKAGNVKKITFKIK